MQIDLPPQSLHFDRHRPWMHMVEPPHSLHAARIRKWMQIPEPPHSRQLALSRLWIHFEVFECSFRDGGPFWIRAELSSDSWDIVGFRGSQADPSCRMRSWHSDPFRRFLAASPLFSLNRVFGTPIALLIVLVASFSLLRLAETLVCIQLY
jgi:hypothetical protein